MMKKIFLFLATIILLTPSCKKNTEDKSSGFYDNGVIAHRGAWKNTGQTQNSLGSLREAIKLGCAGSELDIQLTLDDSLIVYHDLIHHGMVIDSTSYEQLITIPLSNGEKIPTLKEYLKEGIKQKNTKLIIDIKTPKNKERVLEAATKALALVKELDAEEWVEYLGGYIPALMYLKENTTSPVAYLGRWVKELPEMQPDSVFSKGFKYIDYQDVHYKNNPSWIEIFKKEGIHLNAWTVNNEEDMNWFINHAFDYITTDEPEKLLTIINKKNN